MNRPWIIVLSCFAGAYALLVAGGCRETHPTGGAGDPADQLARERAALAARWVEAGRRELVTGEPYGAADAFARALELEPEHPEAGGCSGARSPERSARPLATAGPSAISSPG